MMKHIALSLFICFLLSCRDKRDFANLIKGDWVGPKGNEKEARTQTQFICFEDSTYSTSLLENALKYKVLKNKLYITIKDGRIIKRTILKLTTDSLILLAGAKRQDTLKYSKVRTKNNITPTTIYFASSECFGICPIMYLAIDSARNVRFYGDYYTSIIGGFSGQISPNEYNWIIRKIKDLPVDSLSEFYEADLSDAQTLGMSIIHGDTVTRSTAYGHYREPIELQILFRKLINLYKTVNLRPDTSVHLISYFLSNPKVAPIMYRPSPPSPIPSLHK